MTPHEVSRNGDLSPNAKAVYIAIDSHANRFSGSAFVGRRLLVEYCRIGTLNIQRAVAELVAAGLIRKEIGRSRRTVYTMVKRQAWAETTVVKRQASAETTLDDETDQKKSGLDGGASYARTETTQGETVGVGEDHKQSPTYRTEAAPASPPPSEDAGSPADENFNPTVYLDKNAPWRRQPEQSDKPSFGPLSALTLVNEKGYVI